jgi:hypothetical protein
MELSTLTSKACAEWAKMIKEKASATIEISFFIVVNLEKLVYLIIISI